MGGKHGAKCIHSLRGLKKKDMAMINRGLAQEMGMLTPTVDVDCMNACYKLGKTVENVVNFMGGLAIAGLRVVPVTDGTRPICKQATNERAAKRKKLYIDAFILRTRIAKLQRELKKEGLSGEERSRITKEIEKKTPTMKSKETQSRNSMPSDFVETLEEELTQTGAHSSSEAGGTIDFVMKAEYQADLLMVGRVLNKETLMVVSSDVDIVLFGGDGCMAVKTFNLRGDGWEIVSTSMDTILNAHKYLDDEAKSRTEIVPAEFPIFDGVEDPMTRAAMALILGCDVCLKGVPGIGASNLQKLIKEEYPEYKESHPDATLLQYLIRYMSDNVGGEDFTPEVVRTYIDALLYEPTNEAPPDPEDEGSDDPADENPADDDPADENPADDDPDDENPARTYLHGAPPKLPKYLKQFAASNTEIFDGPDIVVCSGTGDHQKHQFLAADGYERCKNCDEIVCQHCEAKKKDEVTSQEDTYCLSCYAVQSLVPAQGASEGRSISEMRDELANEWDVERADELTIEEVEDLYELKEVAFARINEMLDGVPFPLHPSREMDAETTVHWDTVLDIDFGEGAAFLMDPDLDSKHLPGILEVFSSLVLFKSAVRTDWVKDPAVFDSMPEIFIKFAQKSRIDTGYRLLMRCIRHAFDSRTPSMQGGKGKLILDGNNDIGVWLCSNIPASMKKKVYETEIVATAKNLLCCKCTCQCGSQEEQRIICVHTLVVLYLLTILMMEDLAEHLLIALAARISGAFDSADGDDAEEDEDWMWNMGDWSDDEVKKMKENVITLMEAAGETTSQQDVISKSLPELLQAFTVGTERRKEWRERSKVPPKPSELRPVHDIDWMSSAKRGKCTMRRCGCTNKKGKSQHQPDQNEAEEQSESPRQLDHNQAEDGSESNSSPAAPNHFNCSYPGCQVSEHSPPQTQEVCRVESCSCHVHRLCQAQHESDNHWHCYENEMYCFRHHPKNPEPNYLKVLALMKAAGCDMDGVKCIGHRLLSARGVEQLNGDFSKQNAAEKEAKKEWLQLQKLAEERSINQTKSQRDNLRKKVDDNIQPPSARPVSPENNINTATGDRNHLRRRNMELPMHKKPVPKKRKRHTKCHKNGCTVNSSNCKGMKFRKVPVYPAELKGSNIQRSDVIKRYGKILLREEVLRCMGIPENDRREYRICRKHKYVQKVKDKLVVYKGEEFTKRFKLVVPEGIGPKSSLIPSTSSRGFGADRQICRTVAKLNETIEDGHTPPDFSVEEVMNELESTKPTSLKEELHLTQEKLMLKEIECDQYKAELAIEKLGRCQDWENNSAEKQQVPLNPSVKRAAGLDVHEDDNPVIDTGRKKLFTSELHQPPNKKTRRNNAKDPPKVTLSIDDDDVQRRTGFPTLQHLLSYVFIVCDGDIDLISDRSTVLTWLEEWIVHLEFKWGRTKTRLRDITTKYGPERRYIIKMIANKYDIERRARSRWPTYASYEEDRRMRKGKWDNKYKEGVRVVMWDMTNIEAYQFSDADYNRFTYSKYYAQNCFKGGVGVQLCGWIVTADLWPGAVSDTAYNKKAGYLEEQNSFAQNDLVMNEIVPFTNIYDKGYRAKMVAWRVGKQMVMQPDWAESDRRFGRNQTLRTASVATDRGGNERAVNVCKRAWFISRGFQQNQSAKQLNDAWLTWSFQANFMFAPVL